MTKAIKRLVDISGSLAGLIVLSPLFLTLAALVKHRMGRPVFFRQLRAGQDGRPFRLWKFRTMTDARDSSGRLLPDDQRLTKLGSFLRSYSLDELPQMINVLLGDMSLVGPRPLLLRYVPRYNERQKLRLTVKPGITGLAQVNGRNTLDWSARLELDAVYAERVSLFLDLQLLLLTLWKVAARDGQGPSAGRDLVQEEFWGTPNKPAVGAGASPVEKQESLRTHTGVPAKQMR